MNIKTTTLIISNLLFANMLFSQQLTYKDPKVPIEQRVDDLIGRMTLEEKIDQLTMKGLSALKVDQKGNVTDSSLVAMFEGESIGCLESPFVEHSVVAKYSEAADKYLRENTRLGIPAIQIAECLHGQMALGTTIFPQAIALGSTWNPDLIKEMASIIAYEASLSGVDQALSPVFDLARDPRYGRTEECYSEDPYLVKKMGVAFVTGMQGEADDTKKGIDSGKIACTAKHFAAYSVPEAGINIAPALVGERELREAHFIPFEAVVKEANIYSVMPGYHELDGVPVHANRWLLDDVLRKEWGFEGYVFSDYGAVSMIHYLHRVADSYKMAALQAIKAGVDLEAPNRSSYKELKTLVDEGSLAVEDIDRAVERVLTIKFKLGLFDRPYKAARNRAKQIHTDESVALSQEIAEQSIVMLKNSDNLLPLKRNELSSIAVIGPNSNLVQFGDYSITKNNDYGTTILKGIENYVGGDVTINYAEGCGITSLSKDGFAEAIEAAKKSDVIVLGVGGTSVIYSGIGWGDESSNGVNTCGEGYDRNELDLPGIQPELLDELSKLGKPIVMVMLNGRAYTLEESGAKADAILEAWYPGERGGDAIARIIFGDVNPSGKLTVTFPPTTGHIKMYAGQKPSARGFYRQPGDRENPGRDYVFSAPKPTFCFGHGLSYTTFEYSSANVKNEINNGGDKVVVEFTLKNSGNYDGAEVAQLYVRDRFSSATTPVKALKAFKKVFLKAGESTTVSLTIDRSDIELWNPEMERVLEPGAFDIYIGSSFEDIRLNSEFEIEG